MSTREAFSRGLKKKSKKHKLEEEEAVVITREPESKEVDIINILKDECLCGACLELLISPVTLPCGHNFCRDCLVEWKNTGRTNGKKCPTCKVDFNPNKLCINRSLNTVLVKLGGSVYKSRVNDREKRLKCVRVLGAYAKSTRFKSVRDIVKGILENKHLEYEELCNELSQYPRLELIYVLGKMYSKNQILIHDNTIIWRENFCLFLQRTRNENKDINTLTVIDYLSKRLKESLNTDETEAINYLREKGIANEKDIYKKISNPEKYLTDEFITELEKMIRSESQKIRRYLSGENVSFSESSEDESLSEYTSYDEETSESY